MNRGRRRFLQFAGAVMAAPALARQALAQGYPARAVRVIVPFAPGGITDILARMIAEHLQDALKQTFVIENVTGASGLIATQRAARALPDGYTLYFTTLSQIVIAPLTQKMDVDPIKAFRPVSLIVAKAEASAAYRSGRPTWACAGCTLAAKKPITASAFASPNGSPGHRPNRLPRYGRMAVFSARGSPLSSRSAGTRPSGLILR